ncbi:hypothetical protein QN277_001921 [Acacia crassicarpa]|uniref:Uncharacterized protein n=1 Tax=Acacia crassicarpa TaxID=499986 RepID=A0AAE1N9H8_9FABA|nr:hypothetical protein QN277_001921 [Acacia crassicarpa]
MSNNEIEAAQQYMLELLYSQASDHISSDHFQQQHDMAEATDSDESATIPREPFVRSHEERTQDPRSPHSSQQPVEDDDVSLDIKEMIQDYGDSALLRECCIYKVPPTLRHLNEKAYTPLVVSIGPIHFGDKELHNMEVHKKNMCRKLINEAGSSWDDLFRFVQDLEPEVRKSYLETFNNLGGPELAELILWDAGYIIQLFIMNYKRDAVGKDAKLLQPSLGSTVFKDLLLLENQLPFFAIEKLFNEAFPHNNRGSLPSFLELTYFYFRRLNVQELKPNDNVEINHFTDLLRSFHLKRNGPTRKRPPSEAGRNILRYNANELQEKGIKLKASDSYCVFDMKFSSNILEIPQLLVHVSARRLFYNMIALEQCHYHDKAYISDYAHILDCLIDTAKDVDLLVSKKIVRNHLGDPKEVATLFNVLGENATTWFFNSNYLDICKKLNDYSQDPWTWTGMKAILRRDYCQTPWHTVVSIVGILVFLLTAVHTTTSILQLGK